MEKVLSAIFHKNVKLNLINGTIFNEVLDNDYTFAIMNELMNDCLNILINGTQTYVISYAAWSNNYENFSNVSNKLKNQTE